PTTPSRGGASPSISRPSWPATPRASLPQGAGRTNGPASPRSVSGPARPFVSQPRATITVSGSSGAGRSVVALTRMPPPASPRLGTNPNAPLVGSQSKGTLSQAGKVLARGYSGFERGKNNPAMQGVKDVGPIPIGRYTIGAPTTYKHTVNAMLLQRVG